MSNGLQRSASARFFDAVFGSNVTIKEPFHIMVADNATFTGSGSFVEIGKVQHDVDFTADSASNTLIVGSIGGIATIAGDGNTLILEKRSDETIVLAEGSADTTVDAGLGNDTIIFNNGAGDATVTGGDGADRFVVTDLDGDYTITDFNPAEGDTISLAGQEVTVGDSGVVIDGPDGSLTVLLDADALI